MKKNKGITLIALVITIIVLLILAGISIATLTGKNGILSRASTAGEETKKAEYKEVLELIGNGLRPEKALENLSAEEFIKRYKEEIEKEIDKEQTLKRATVEERNETTLWVITSEKYVYEITENEVKFLGQQGQNPPLDLQEGDINFKLNPTNYTNGNVTVELIPVIEMEGYILQYSIDSGTSWKDYKTSIIVENNGVIHARLVNLLGEEGGTASKEIDTIDREEPNKANINFDETTVEEGKSITATVTQSDRGVSGIDITKCKWVYNDKSIEIGKNEASYTGGTFREEQEEVILTISIPGTYYLHILTVDKAGNTMETVSTAITIKKLPTVEELKNGDEINYIAKNGSAIRCKVLWDINSTYGQNGVQIISMSNVGNVKIGVSTTMWGETAGYINNSITTLNNRANNYLNTTFAKSARCVGSKPGNPTYENKNRWPTGYTGDVTIRGVDENYVADVNQMKQLGIHNISTNYWLASRGVKKNTVSNMNEIGVRWYDGSKVQSTGSGFSSNGSGFFIDNGTMWKGPTYGFRPVFTLKPEVKIIDNGGSYTLKV